MIKVFKDKNLRNNLFKLMIPFMLQELVVVLTTALNTIILGISGANDATLTSVGYVFQIYFLYNTIICSIAFIGNLFVAQHYGAKRMNDVSLDYHLCLKLSLAVSILFFLISISLPEQLINIFANGNKSVIEAGVKYLRIFSITFIPTGIIMIDYMLMKNIGLERYSSLNSIITFVMTLTFNLIFLLALKDSPVSGIIGAALSLLLARIIELTICIIFTHRKSEVNFKFNQIFINDIKLFKSFIKYGAPMLIGKISWSMGFVMVSVCIARIGDSNFSTANQLMLTAENLAMCINTGMAAAIGVIIGRELGANNIEQAKTYTSDLNLFILLEGIVNMLVFLALLPLTSYVFGGADTATTELLWKFFLIQAPMFIPRAYNAAYENGIFNAGGDQLFIALVDGVPWWVSVIPLGFLGVYLNWDPIVILIILQLEEVVKFPFNIYRYRSKKWARNIIEEKKELFNA